MLDQIIWRDASEGSGRRLLATIEILGCPMHLEAFEVAELDQQQAADEEYRDTFDKIAEAISISSPWREVEINGRNYVLIATPHCI